MKINLEPIDSEVCEQEEKPDKDNDLSLYDIASTRTLDELRDWVYQRATDYGTYSPRDFVMSHEDTIRRGYRGNMIGRITLGPLSGTVSMPVESDTYDLAIADMPEIAPLLNNDTAVAVDMATRRRSCILRFRVTRTRRASHRLNEIEADLQLESIINE